MDILIAFSKSLRGFLMKTSNINICNQTTTQYSSMSNNNPNHHFSLLHQCWEIIYNTWESRSWLLRTSDLLGVVFASILKRSCTARLSVLNGWINFFFLFWCLLILHTTKHASSLMDFHQYDREKNHLYQLFVDFINIITPKVHCLYSVDTCNLEQDIGRLNTVHYEDMENPVYPYEWALLMKRTHSS